MRKEPNTEAAETVQTGGDQAVVQRLVRLSEVTDDILDAVENEVGMGCGTWDCVPPKKIIAAAWKFMPTTDAEPVAWYHDDFGVIELSRVQRVGWKPLYSVPNDSDAGNG
jgi:hypothetical protein